MQIGLKTRTQLLTRQNAQYPAIFANIYSDMKHLKFVSRDDFRNWLKDNALSDQGVWLLFGKTAGEKTLSANDALEEALCFGWIDGQIKNIDDKNYIKYFAQRRKDSKWSAKNKAAAEKLEKQGLMSAYGKAKMKEAKENGRWDAPKTPSITEEHIDFLTDLLKKHKTAHQNFQAMPPSVRKTYTRAYLDAKTDEGRDRRLLWIIDRLNKNLRPM